MCQAVTPQVNTLADGQLGTGWPHRRAPGGRVGKGRRRQEEGGGEVRQGKKGEEELGVKKERRGICTEGPEPRSSHPEDPCSLAGWLQRRRGEEGGDREREV